MSARIAYVLNTIGLGGVPEVALQLLQHLPSGDYQPFIFVLKPAETEASARETLRQRIAAFGAELYISEHSAGRLGVVAELADWLHTRQIALLHTHSYRPNLYGRLAGALCRPNGLRIVAHYHNQYDDKWQKNPCDLALEKHLARHTDALIAVSQSVSSHITERLELTPDRITVMLNGIDEQRFRPVDKASARAAYGLHADAQVVGLVGRICAQKGVEEFVDAALHLAAPYPKTVFLVAGNAEDAAMAARLAARATAEGLSERIRFLGHQQQMARFYAALDILAAPSRWEGFGLMLAEAMACGLPIVATRVGAIPEVVEEYRTALLVEPGNSHALAGALKKLLDHPARRLEMGAAGPARAARYNWTTSGQQLHALYQRLLETGDLP